MQRSTLASLGAIAALAAAYFTGTSVATSQKAGPANNIATVNIQTIFENLDERKDKLEALQREAGRLEGEFKAISDQINAARDTANKLPEGPAKDAALDAVVDRDVQANIDIKKAKGKLEKAQADTIRMIFNKIQAEAKVMANKNGYSMVMVADDWVQISNRATAQEATQIMSLRRFLYIDSKQHDITADLLKSLNTAYAVTKPPAPAAPGSTPPPATTPPAAANPATPAAPNH